jgi:Carboxypeptidase regulatory-like domain
MMAPIWTSQLLVKTSRSFLGVLGFAFLFVVAGCLLTDRREAKRGSEVENEVYGFLVDTNGRTAQGAMVWAHTATGFQLPSGSNGRSNDAVDSATTDSDGRYAFENLQPGEYNFIAELPQGGQPPLVALIPEIALRQSTESVDLGTDTLRAAGAIKGRVTLGGAGREGGIAYLPGTAYLAFSDANGEFLITGVPQGFYSVHYLLTGYQAQPDSGVTVNSGLITVLPDKELGYDSALLPPAPTRLKAEFDTATSTVRLEWSAIKVSDLLGYLVYRDTGLYSAPVLVTPTIITDTVFIENVSQFALRDAVPDIAYRVISIDRDKNTSVQFSPAAKVTLARPDIKILKLALKRLDRADNRSSIGDSVRMEVSYSNPVLKLKKVEWWVTGSTSPIQVRIDSGHFGHDTLVYAWKASGNPYIAVVVTDESGPSFPHSMILNVLQDPPTVHAGGDVSVILGDTVLLKGTAKQEFGTIQSYAWDLGGTGEFQFSSNGQLLLHADSSNPSVIPCILKVTDDDGNEGFDTAMVRVISNPSLIDLGEDKEASASDTIRLQGRALARPIKNWEWDIGGSGRFIAGQSDTLVTLPSQNTGTILCILKATDTKGLVDLDTVSIVLVPDFPKAVLSATPNPAPVGGRLTLSASQSSDKFGRIVEWAWKIGDESSFIPASGKDTTLIVPDDQEGLLCALRVTDDDGLSSTDSLRILRPPPGSWVKSHDISALHQAGFGNSKIGTGFGKVWFLGRPNNSNFEIGLYSSSDMSTWEYHPSDSSWNLELWQMSPVYEWKGKLWIVFYNQATFHNEFWGSLDGKKWEKLSQPVEFMDRMGFDVLSFNGKLWIVSGVDGFINDPIPDAWYSEDGLSWTRATESLPFKGSTEAKTVVFDQRLWILGISGNPNNEGSNEVWNSSNGIDWTKVGEIPAISTINSAEVASHDGKLWLLESGLHKTNGVVGKAWHSVDGVTWSKDPDPPGFNPLESPKLINFKNRLWLLGFHFTTRDVEAWVAP